MVVRHTAGSRVMHHTAGSRVVRHTAGSRVMHHTAGSLACYCVCSELVRVYRHTVYGDGFELSAASKVVVFYLKRSAAAFAAVTRAARKTAVGTARHVTTAGIVAIGFNLQIEQQ